MMQSGWKLSAWMPASKPLAATAILNDRSTGKLTLEVFDQDLVLTDDQHLGHRFVFEVAQGACRVL